MKNKHKEIVFLRTFAITIALGFIAFLSYFFKQANSIDQKFGTIDVERINIVEKDGTVKMLITNADHFPTKGDSINGRIYHKRKKRAGMLFFTEDGKECGGFIYDGSKTKDGHEAGLSLTYDQYDGDQVMQLLSTDRKVNGVRKKYNYLLFNDRNDDENKEKMTQISEELQAIKDPKERMKKRKEYLKKGYFNGVRRIALGQVPGQQNGLFLFDDKGKPRAKFCINKNNEVKLVAYDSQGNIVGSWPNK